MIHIIQPHLGLEFPSGTPATSTSQNPTVSYPQPGVYPVTLTASDGTSSITETKSYYIRVLPAPTWIPYWEGLSHIALLII